MKGFEFKPPKEFGPRSHTGLGKLHGLHGNPSPPFAKAIQPGVTSYKNNGFDVIINDPLAPLAVANIVLDGRPSTGGPSQLYAANALRGKFVPQPLTVVGGEAGSVQLGISRSVFVAAFTSFSNFSLYRARNLQSKTLEFSDASAYPSVGMFIYLTTLGATYFRTGPVVSPTVIEYETCSFDSLDTGSGCVVPQVVYRSPTAWEYATVAAYLDYDQPARRSSTRRLSPSVTLAIHAVVPKGRLYGLYEAGVYSPSGQVPYPLMQISTDCSRTYAPLDTDYMFAGCYDAMSYVAGAGGLTGAGAGLGGFYIAESMLVVPLLNSTFISFSLKIDSPDITEVRIFRVDSFNFSSATRISLPPGYGEFWTRAPILSFASPVGPSLNGTLGLVVDPLDMNLPAMIYLTTNLGASWAGPFPLPCSAYFGRAVVDVSDRELWLSAYEATTTPQVVHYSSTDFGVTWEREQVISTSTPTLGPTDALVDFYAPVVLDTGTVTLANSRPMNPAVYDSRISNTPRLNF